MKVYSFLLTFAASLALAPVSAAAVIEDSALAVPRGEVVPDRFSLLARGNHKKEKDNWGNAVEKDRKKVTIRASKDDRDDISDEFLKAIHKANNGGLVHLKKGKKYVIGKKLDLSFLKDVYVRIDGELKVRTHYGRG